MSEASHAGDYSLEPTLQRPGKHASREEVAAYRRAKARQGRIKAAKERPPPTGESGGMLRRF